MFSPSFTNPALKKNKTAFDKKKVKVVLVNIGENDAAAVARFIEKMGLQNYSLICDNYKRLSEAP